jgi:hypothetical protein
LRHRGGRFWRISGKWAELPMGCAADGQQR